MRSLSCPEPLRASRAPTILVAFLLAFAGPTPTGAGNPPATGPAGSGSGDPGIGNSRTAQASYGRLPLHFERNEGQTDPRVRFLSRGLGYGLFLASTEAVLSLHRLPPSRGTSFLPGESPRRPEPAPGSVIRISLVGANGAAEAVGVDELPGKANYFIGSDPKRWRTNVSTYGRVRFENVYPGIDLLYYGKDRQLEYDFFVHPGADPERIALKVEGAALHLDSSGDLVLENAGDRIHLRKPLTYQEVNGVRREVASGYVLKGRGRAGFRLAEYDATRPVTIDPVLDYASYLGGSGTDVGQGIAVDAAGNAYVTGFTDSLDFPRFGSLQPFFRGGTFDAFVTKVNPTGTALLYSTYLGGSDIDVATGIGVDAAGNAVVAGWTSSADFPTTPGASHERSPEAPRPS